MVETTNLSASTNQEAARDRTIKGSSTKRVAEQRAYAFGAPKPLNCDIAKNATQRLQASPYYGLRSLHCEFHEGILVIRGRVRSYFQLQMAQEAVRNLCGAELILNAVEVMGVDS